MLGVTPLRDTLLPLLSLRGLLGFPPQAERAAREKVVVARVGGALVGLLADRMRTIFPADAGLIEKIPPVLCGPRPAAKSKITAIYRGDGGRRLVSLLSPEQLFREDVMQRLNAGEAARTEERRTIPADHAGEERQFVVFRLGDDEFGLPIEAVNEVARVPDQITRLPRTPKFLEGVVNLRGEVLPVVDQRRRFDMPAALRSRARRRLVVVRTERHRAGLIVDSVSEVLRCFADDIEPAPDLTNEAVAARQWRDQSREGRAHRAAARSGRIADPRRARPARCVQARRARRRARPARVPLGDQGSRRRQLGADAQAAGQDLLDASPTSRSGSRATGWRRWRCSTSSSPTS